MIANQNINLTLVHSFVYNLTFQIFKWKIWASLSIFTLKILYCSKMAQFWTLFTICIFVPKIHNIVGFNFQNEKNYLRMLGHLWKGIWILGHYHDLMPLSYLNLNHEPKVKVMTKLMSTTPPIPHVCYKISKHKKWNSIKYPRDKAQKCEIVPNPYSYPLGFQK
jgi:hypothetical protein